MPKRAVSIVLSALLVLPITACGEGGGGETKVMVIGPEPTIRDPSSGELSPGEAVLDASVAQGLVSFDAAGNIVGALAERWNVSDDGLSYIFRLAPTKWNDGRKLTAEQVARSIRRSLSSRSKNRLSDTLGAVEDVVAMTDRVIEIRLSAPRPNLLALLAQPEFSVFRGTSGSGPFNLAAEKDKDGWLVLDREIVLNDEADNVHERVLLKGDAAEKALAGFASGDVDLVLGGTFADLPLAQRTNVPAAALQFDPAAGLFGLVPMRADGPAADADIRNLLSRALDRGAFISTLKVRGLVGRATLLEAGLDGNIAPAAPPWAGQLIDERRQAAIADAKRMIGGGDRPLIRVYLPEGPGADILFNRLQSDWSAIGFSVERAARARGADFALVDAVAPSLSPAWFIRQFRCDATPICSADVDELLAAARSSVVPAQRAALLAQAAALADSKTLFIPISAPIRWSMVGDGIDGFAVNRFARHTLTGLRSPKGAKE